MVKAASCEEGFFHLLMDLVHAAWCECRVSMKWSDAVLVPIPKNSDLGKCDNLRGISLLMLWGKLLEESSMSCCRSWLKMLPESQCGFKKTREWSDMIYTIRQLIEKSGEHRAKSSITFIDLKKAYVKVPKCAMWLALMKFSVPENIIKHMHSFLNGMEASIHLDGTLIEEFSVENGLRQGCCMAPVLFNLYTCLVMEC